MEITDIPVKGFERVVRAVDRASGLHAIVAIHSSVLGPALGGLRMWPYASEEEALFDVCRLARGMSYKSAVAMTGLGGGKAVIIGDPKSKSETLYLAMGRFIESLDGKYTTTEDVNTDPGDLDVIRRATKWVCGLERAQGGSGNPSPYTAHGVLVGIQAALGSVFGDDSCKGRSVAIQGAGAVGSTLARRLRDAGAVVYCSDRNHERVHLLQREVGVIPVGEAGIITTPCDVFAPCALGAILNDESIPKLSVRIVAGAANNVLLAPAHGKALAQRGILYAPDYVINAGGLINVVEEFAVGGYDERRALARIERTIPQALREIWRVAKEDGIPPSEAANRIAEQIIEAAKARTASAKLVTSASAERSARRKREAASQAAPSKPPSTLKERVGPANKTLEPIPRDHILGVELRLLLKAEPSDAVVLLMAGVLGGEKSVMVRPECVTDAGSHEPPAKDIYNVNVSHKLEGFFERNGFIKAQILQILEDSGSAAIYCGVDRSIGITASATARLVMEACRALAYGRHTGYLGEEAGTSHRGELGQGNKPGDSDKEERKGVPSLLDTLRSLKQSGMLDMDLDQLSDRDRRVLARIESSLVTEVADEDASDWGADLGQESLKKFRDYRVSHSWRLLEGFAGLTEDSITGLVKSKQHEEVRRLFSEARRQAGLPALQPAFDVYLRAIGGVRDEDSPSLDRETKKEIAKNLNDLAASLGARFEASDVRGFLAVTGGDPGSFDLRERRRGEVKSTTLGRGVGAIRLVGSTPLELGRE